MNFNWLGKGTWVFKISYHKVRLFLFLSVASSVYNTFVKRKKIEAMATFLETFLYSFVVVLNFVISHKMILSDGKEAYSMLV